MVAFATSLALLVPDLAGAQVSGPSMLEGTVMDAAVNRPVAQAEISLRRIMEGAEEASSRTAARGVITGSDGRYSFDHLERGRYRLHVERLGYKTTTLEVTLDRDQPLFMSILLEPRPLPIAPVDSRISWGGGPTLLPPPIASADGVRSNRAAAIRVRQLRFLAPDVRQLSYDDMREANTLAEDDLLRALQRLPGVGARDDYTADMWTRGAPAGQTAVLFDGIPVVGARHALGALSGLNTDMLATVTFQPGVASAALQGGTAAVIETTTRSGLDGDGLRLASLSPLSARFSAQGSASDRVGWAFAARRSWIDALSRVARGIGLTSRTLPYTFQDVTARVDLALGPGSRVETSAFWQDDRVSGDVPPVAYGNEGDWGTFVVRSSVVTPVPSVDAVLRNTIGLTGFNASVVADAAPSPNHFPLHPFTRNQYTTLVWESRLDGQVGSGEGWSAGFRATREDHSYSGPGIDLTRLLSPEEVARRGVGDLTPAILGLRSAFNPETSAMTRLSFWGEGRARLRDRLEILGGLRLEAGSKVAGDRARLAPRMTVRWGAPDGALTVAAGYGRSYQYLQSVATTDVIRSGLRVSEILRQADRATPALRADVMTLGGEAWLNPTWLLGATLWGRVSDGNLLPDPSPGIIDGPRPAVPASEQAEGLELSARRVAGRVRGFANYSLSRATYRAGGREFAASEDRRHMTNVGVVADATAAWRLGTTLWIESGAPYTRITLIDTDCNQVLGCAADTPVFYGTPSGQRAPVVTSLDLMAAWTREFDGWSLTAYGQLRNALGNANKATYHSSCLCVDGSGGGRGSLRDRFDRGLPRLPLAGFRVRF